MIIFLTILIVAICLATIFHNTNMYYKVGDWLQIMWILIGMASFVFILLSFMAPYEQKDIDITNNISKIEQLTPNSNIYLYYSNKTFIIRDIEAIQYIRKKDYKLFLIKQTSFFGINIATHYIITYENSKRSLNLNNYTILY